ncbi:MAG: hypothetical protein CMH27_06070 [Micavibrio sp.]|nr:hypothetical protein [Micavibrio sp.]
MKIDTSRIRLQFRIALLCILLASFTFFTTMVVLRVHGGAHWYVVKNYQEQIFTADIIQHRAKLLFQDNEQDYATAEEMLKDGVFSPSYTRAGLVILQHLANEGFNKAQVRYADIILRGYRLDENTELKRTTANDIHLARHYYEMAAAEGYTPALAKIAMLDVLNN